MELAKWISLMALWISANGQDDFQNPDTQNYRYNYFVRDENTGDIKSHEEKKLGDSVVGQYTVGEPTGDLRVVSYTADEGGFRANVKYEEGGSPLSDIRDKARQVNPATRFEFEWLPGNPDNAEQAVGKTEEPGSPSNEVVDMSSEEKGSTEGTSETTTASSEELASDISPVSENTNTESEKDNSASDEESVHNLESSPAPEQKENDSQQVTDSKSKESDSREGTSDSNEENSNGNEVAEGAESAPEEQQAEPTAPSQSYLPPYPMQTLPIYSQPMAQPAGRESDRPTIIYASQNFYNPWQWFGSTARVQREEPAGEPQGHYMTGLGYIIAPPRPEQ